MPCYGYKILKVDTRGVTPNIVVGRSWDLKEAMEQMEELAKDDVAGYASDGYNVDYEIVGMECNVNLVKDNTICRKYRVQEFPMC